VQVFELDFDVDSLVFVGKGAAIQHRAFVA
jgi:hypothetical protein